MMEGQNRLLLTRGAESLGVALSPAQVEAVDRYLGVLKKWSMHINLTAIHDEREQVIKLILDSLPVVPIIKELCHGFSLPASRFSLPASRFSLPPSHSPLLLDLGSGAGLPGIPVKIAWPEAGMVLAESRDKRAQFLKEVIRELALSRIEVQVGRAEEVFKRDLAGRSGQSSISAGLWSQALTRSGFDLVLARAVGELGALAKAAKDLARPGGFLIAMKGPDPRREVETSQAEFGRRGFQIHEVHLYRLPESGVGHSLIVLRKA
jgi:16S rRNA (guanine527-N7)-methyltransferase